MPGSRMNCGPMTAEADGTSVNAVLGGRLRLRQPLKGHRVGHDAILLAAATGGRAGERAVELGAGVGAAGLALAARVGGLHVTLIEIDPALAALAADNAQLNQLADRVIALCADAESTPAMAAAGLEPSSTDRVLMNPPFRDPARQNVSPDARRRLAHVGALGLLQRWIASAAWLLKPGGVLTLIWHADRLGEARQALQSAFGAVAVLSVLPRADKPAIRVLVRAVKGAAAASREQPPLILNDAQNKPTVAAEAALRHGQILSFADT
jgi:tRNA1(Val) A37 N6-methylase TrmN6